MRLLAVADDLTPRMVRERAHNSQYVQAFDNEAACKKLEDEGFTPLWSRTVDGDSVWIRFWDFGKDADTFRIEGADFIRTTDLESACGESGTLVESSNVGYAYGTHSNRENYLRAVKRVLSSCGNGYDAARSSFARMKAEHGIKAAREAFRMELFTAKLMHGEYDPNGYASGNWTARTEERIIPCLTQALEVA